MVAGLIFTISLESIYVLTFYKLIQTWIEHKQG